MRTTLRFRISIEDGGEMTTFQKVTFARLRRLDRETARKAVELTGKGGYRKDGVHYFLDRASCSKALAKQRGHKGATGGWIYTAEGLHICHGWTAYWTKMNVQWWLLNEVIPNLPEQAKGV